MSVIDAAEKVYDHFVKVFDIGDYECTCGAFACQGCKTANGVVEKVVDIINDMLEEKA